MREITTHKVNGLNEALDIAVLDEPGHGGACHRYDITGFDTKTNPSRFSPDGFESSFARTPIIFQNGPIREHGVNGISNEALLAVLIDRMDGFQSGPYACEANAMALGHLQQALAFLQKRTLERVERGVEGTSQQ